MRQFSVNEHPSRKALNLLTDSDLRRKEASRSVKMLIAPRDATVPISDAMIPDVIVTESMVTRYLQIAPPSFFVTADFERIAYEIERTFVLGEFFSAVAAACVTIERVLNSTRIALHKHHTKIGGLWSKGPVNDWIQNVEALRQWNYLDDMWAKDLIEVYKQIRCHYLHSGNLENLEGDAQKAVNISYKVIERFFGFPEDLFEHSSAGIQCKNEQHPLFIEFYAPTIVDTPA